MIASTKNDRIPRPVSMQERPSARVSARRRGQEVVESKIKKGGEPSKDIADVLFKIQLFLRFNLKRRGSIKNVELTKGGWRVWVEVADPRRDLAKRYQTVYEQNIYLIELDREMNITDFGQVGELRQKLPEKPEIPPPVVDKKMVEEVAREIAKGIRIPSSSPAGAVTQEEEIQIKKVFIDPSEKVSLDHNFERLGSVNKSDQAVDSTVERLKNFKRRRKD